MDPLPSCTGFPMIVMPTRRHVDAGGAGCGQLGWGLGLSVAEIGYRWRRLFCRLKEPFKGDPLGQWMLLSTPDPRVVPVLRVRDCASTKKGCSHVLVHQEQWAQRTG